MLNVVYPARQSKIRRTPKPQDVVTLTYGKDGPGERSYTGIVVPGDRMFVIASYGIHPTLYKPGEIMAFNPSGDFTFYDNAVLLLDPPINIKGNS